MQATHIDTDWFCLNVEQTNRMENKVADAIISLSDQNFEDQVFVFDRFLPLPTHWKDAPLPHLTGFSYYFYQVGSECTNIALQGSKELDDSRESNESNY